MDKQLVGKPDVTFSWILNGADFPPQLRYNALDAERGRKELVDAILLCISQGHEIRIGTDGLCLILESNYIGDENESFGCYQFIDEDHFDVLDMLEEKKNAADEDIYDN